MKKRTVRELGGEIWAEINARIHEQDNAFVDLSVDVENAIIDLLMGVLARYDGAVIINDPDLPVEVLPSTYNIDAS